MLTFVSSLPCLHTFWHAIPTSSYIFNVFYFLVKGCSRLHTGSLADVACLNCSFLLQEFWQKSRRFFIHDNVHQSRSVTRKRWTCVASTCMPATSRSNRACRCLCPCRCRPHIILSHERHAFAHAVLQNCAAACSDCRATRNGAAFTVGAGFGSQSTSSRCDKQTSRPRCFTTRQSPGPSLRFCRVHTELSNQHYVHNRIPRCRRC